MRSRVLVVVILVVACLTLSATVLAADLPYESNGECLECHDAIGGDAAFASVDFTASGVDYAACNACHREPPHYDTGDQCNMCHLPWPTRTVFYDGSHILAGGFYDTATSLETDPATLHEIHVNGSWLKGLLTYSGCDTCHQRAACTACHTGDVPHGDHTLDPDTGEYAYPPKSYKACDGSSVRTVQVTCVGGACHALAAAGSDAFDAPLCTGCHVAQHDAQNAAHDASASTCGGAGCHDATDITVPHGATPEEPLTGCATCHGPTVTPAAADCATCHPTIDHHAVHDASSLLPPGCSRCHSMFLDDEHARAGLACADCHDSTDAVVLAAIETGDRHCDTCHPTRHYWRRGR